MKSFYTSEILFRAGIVTRSFGFLPEIPLNLAQLVLMSTLVALSFLTDTNGISLHRREKHFLFYTLAAYALVLSMRCICNAHARASSDLESNHCTIEATLEYVVGQLLFMLVVVSLNYRITIVKGRISSTAWRRNSTPARYLTLFRFRRLRFVTLGYWLGILITVLIIGGVVQFGWRFLWAQRLLQLVLSAWLLLMLEDAFKPVNEAQLRRDLS